MGTFLSVALVGLLLAAPPLSPQDGGPVVGWIAAHQHELLDEYEAFLRLPNVATDEAAIRRNAEALVAMMERRGLQPRLLEIDDGSAPPAVYGEWSVPGADRTLVLYAHYDGLEADPADWASDPWTPTWRDSWLGDDARVVERRPGDLIDPGWRLYARSAADGKAGVFAVLAATDALKAAGLAPTVNLKFFFGGEEKQGSPHLLSLLERHHEALATDAWVVCDGTVRASGGRQLLLRLPGDADVEVTVYEPKRLLSGGGYGDVALRLSGLLASMQDAIDLPSLNINRRIVGSQERNLIRSEARATLDLRLVEGNTVERQFERLVEHIRAQGYHVLDRAPTDEERLAHPRLASVVLLPGSDEDPRTPMDMPIARDVIAAMRTVADEDVVLRPTLDGSLPMVVITEVTGAPAIMIPLVNPDNNRHTADENLRVGNLWDGIAAMAAVMRLPDA